MSSPGTTPPIPAVNTARRLPALDGLRGIVYLVLLRHYYVLGDSLTSWPARTYRAIVELSSFTIDIFFVLSGFLITGILLDSKGSPSFFRAFYGRRVLRIFPLYYGFLLVYFVVLPRVTSGDVSMFHVPPLTAAAYWTYLTNVLAALRGWHALAPQTEHMWTLAVEEQFYALWPLVIVACRRSRFRQVCLGCVFGATLVRLALRFLHVDAEAILMPSRMDGLALGAFFAVAAREGGLAPFVRWARPVGLAAFGVMLATYYVHGSLELTSWIVETVVLPASVLVAGAVLLVTLGSAPGGPWHRTLASWPARQLGQYSYAIYLLHWPLAMVLDRFGWIRGADFDQRFSNPLVAELAYTATMLALSTVAGVLSWHLYEKHFLKLRRRLPYRYAPAPRARTSAS
jgi:peptidoglycan/LPS O-acetylase OafA/YrhL